MIQSDIYTRILGSVLVATGAPNDSALENYNTTTLDDGALCYVQTGAPGMWQLERSSAAAPDGSTIVAPAVGGPGRWFKRWAPGPPGTVYYQTIQNPAGVAQVQQPIFQFTGSGVSVANDGPGTRTVVTLVAGVSSVVADTSDFVEVTEAPAGVFTVSTPNARITASQGIVIGNGTPSDPSITQSSVFIGPSAGNGLSAGAANNVAIGRNAGGSNNGTFNVSLGYGSSQSLTGSSSFNVAVGNAAGAVGGFVGTVAVGASSQTLANYQIVLGANRSGPSGLDHFVVIGGVLAGITDITGANGGTRAAVAATVTGNANLSTQAAKFCTFASTTIGDTIAKPSYAADHSAVTGGAKWELFQGTASPVAAITASPGSLYYRVSGTSSSMWQHTGSVANNTSWSQFVTSGNITPTDFATSAKVLAIISSAANPYTVASATDWPFKLIAFSAAASIVLPNDAADANMPIGACIQFYPTTATMATFSVSGGGTLLGEGGANKSAVQYGVVVATKVAANTWLLTGRITT